MELVGGPVMGLVTAGLLFGPAGRVDWPGAWLYLALTLVWSVGHTIALAIVNPALLNLRGARSRGMRGWDAALMTVFGLAWPFGVPLAAGLQLATPHDPDVPTMIAGAVLHLVGTALFTWSALVNAGFDKPSTVPRERPPGARRPARAGLELGRRPGRDRRGGDGGPDRTRGPHAPRGARRLRGLRSAVRWRLVPGW